MKDSILISPEYGLNPSLIVCPICGKDIGVALNGRIKNDEKAPKTVRDVQPCEKCISDLESYKDKGFTVIVLFDEFEKIKKTLSPWLFFKELHVLKYEVAEKIFPPDIFKAKKCFTTEFIWKQLTKDNKND